MDKLLTLVIPTYNMEKYLHKCLDSLIIKDDNLFNTLEVLVVIDGAKDSSSMIAHEYQEMHPNVYRVIDKENGNYGSCINRGLKEAKGKYIKILDADDFFDNKVFEQYLIQLSDVDADLVLNDFILVDENNVRIEKRRLYLYNDGLYPFEQLVPKLKCRDLQMHAMAYRTQNLLDIGYFQTEGISYTDQQWAFTPLSTVKSVYVTNLLLYLYLVGRTGQTMDVEVRKKNFYQNIICIKKMIEDFCSVLNPSEYIGYKLLSHLKGIYYYYLIECPEKDMKDILELDVYISEKCPTIYFELERIRINPIIPIYFIKKWHSNSSSRIPAYYKNVSLIGRALCKGMRKVGINIPML